VTRVIVTSSGGLEQSIQVRDHHLTADEPAEGGGRDAGPNPYELLLAALGACTAMTLRMYADRKQWPLEGVEVTLEHDRIHAEDCRDCETREGRLDRIRKELRLLGPLDEAQRQRLGEIAERCPVSQTLKREVVMEQQLR
jgi:uncharacterized OsmC-like protein